jgi:hypothetical protein
LKNQYAAIAQIQRAALSVLSEKSLTRLTNDPKYHETLPEFERVQNTLKQNYDQHLLNLQQEYDRKMAYLHFQKETNDDYERVRLFVSCSHPFSRLFSNQINRISLMRRSLFMKPGSKSMLSMSTIKVPNLANSMRYHFPEE